MALFEGVGERVLGNFGELSRHRGLAKAGIVGAMGLAGIAGTARAMTKKDGIWRQEVYPQAQQLAFGSPRMIQDSMEAGLTAVLQQNTADDRPLPNDVYYGRPVNLGGNPNSGVPVSGEIVLGMHNLRR